MTTTQAVVGVAVSKVTLAVCHQVGARTRHLEVANTPVGFRQLVRCGGATSLYVLEATGEGKLLATVEARYPPEMQLRRSIASIGRKTAAYLLLFAGDFTSFRKHRQLLAKAGLCPREFSSGTSVGGKARISKLGGALIRSKLFRCSWSARRANGAGRVLYDRLVANGKSGKLVLLAVCNKLLQQAYAIVTSGLPYQADFTRKAAKPLAF